MQRRPSPSPSPWRSCIHPVWTVSRTRRSLQRPQIQIREPELKQTTSRADRIMMERKRDRGPQSPNENRLVLCQFPHRLSPAREHRGRAASKNGPGGDRLVLFATPFRIRAAESRWCRNGCITRSVVGIVERSPQSRIALDMRLLGEQALPVELQRFVLPPKTCRPRGRSSWRG